MLDVPHFLPDPEFLKEPPTPQERRVVPGEPHYQDRLDAEYRHVAEVVRDGEDPGYEQTKVNPEIARNWAIDHPRRSAEAVAAQAEEKANNRKRLGPKPDSEPTIDYKNPPFDERNLATSEHAGLAHEWTSTIGEALQELKKNRQT